MVQAGVLGPVSEVYVWTNRPVWDQGKPRSPEKPVPKNLNWELFLGPAPQRPYSEDYHPFSWRGWWDFGTGSLGDMGCHTMNMPYMALDLRNPVSVQAETTGHNRDSYPSKSRVTYEFAATERHPALKMYWLDGEQTPPAELLQQFNEGAKKQGRAAGAAPEKFEASGALLIGEKGMLYAPGDYAGSFMLSGVEAIEAPFEESIGHFDEFIRAIKGGKPAASNFPDYAGPLTETVLLGNLACWVANEPGTPGKKIEWDAKKMQATNAPELASLVRRQYRAGYSL
jgi:predicted dehydrogenase